MNDKYNNGFYYYFCVERPATPGAIPRGVVSIRDLDPNVMVDQLQRGAYSVIGYRRKLTEGEIWAFELVPVKHPEEVLT